MFPKVIGVVGRKRSGKSTVADHFVRKYGYRRMSFSSPIKRMLDEIDVPRGGIDRELPESGVLGKSARYMMQTLGTEWGRDLIHPDIWIYLLHREWVHEGRPDIVIDDVRFQNEASFINKHGLLLCITRPQTLSLRERFFPHRSERLRIREKAVIIRNDGNLRDLRNLLDSLIDHLDHISPSGQHGSLNFKGELHAKHIRGTRNGSS